MSGKTIGHIVFINVVPAAPPPPPATDGDGLLQVITNPFRMMERLEAIGLSRGLAHGIGMRFMSGRRLDREELDVELDLAIYILGKHLRPEERLLLEARKPWIAVALTG